MLASDPSPRRAHLTGVGRVLRSDPSTASFPRNSETAWERLMHKTQGMGQEQLGEFWIRFTLREVIVLHDVCWFLLGQALRPKPVLVQRIFAVCNSLPSPPGLPMAWGHTFGGLISVDAVHSFPWNIRMVNIVPRNLHGHWANLLANPLSPLPAALMTMPPEGPPRISELNRQRLPTDRDLLPNSQDPFRDLPLEVCNDIAVHLSMSDFGVCRLVSRSFTCLFYSQAFWKARFDPGSERSWFFEAQYAPRDFD